MIYRNRVKEAIQKSGLAMGTFIQTASPENAEIAAACGFDFLILDMEHGSFGMDQLVHLIRGVQIGGATPMVRLPDHSETNIHKVLDAGATGIVLPGVSTAEQAGRIAHAARYAPAQTAGRDLNAIRPRGHHQRQPPSCSRQPTLRRRRRPRST